MAQHSKITDVPTNVKEAIDWLIRIGELDKSQSNGRAKVTNAKAIEKAIQKLTGSTRSFQREIQNLIQGLGTFLGRNQTGTIGGGGIIKKNGYTSAYQQGTATWPTCNQGGTCSCCTTSNNKCNCTASPTKSCDGSCCNTCDIRICAGIFVALVPALETALDGLKRRCSTEAKNKDHSSKKIHESPFKEMFTALGYQGDQLNTGLKGSHVNTKLSSAINQLGQLKNKILGRDGYFKGIDNSASSTSPSSSTSTSSPRTVREMLIWLMGLPYCEGYKKFVEKLKGEKDIVSSTGRNNDYHLHRQLSAVIFHLPTVFYSIEGGIAYLNEVFEQFKNGGTLKFKYPTTETDMLNTLSAYVAVCYPILKYLMQRCDVDNRRSRGRRDTRAQTSTPVADEHNGAWGDLLVSGNENSSTEGPQTKSSTAAPSSAPPTALRDYLVFMGFNATNNKVTGDQLHDKALKDCFSESVKTDDEDEDDKGPGTGRTRRSPTSKYHKLPALRKLAKKVLQEAYSSAAGAASGGGGSSSGSTPPSTIRQMMLWIIGLPLTEAYKSSDAKSLFGEKGPVLQGIKSNTELMALEKGQSGALRRSSAPTTATGKHFKQQLKDSIVGMIMLFQRIEGSVHSVLEFLQKGFIDKSGGGSQGVAPGNGKFKYEQDKLLDVFSSYVYKVHVQLRFLMVMCKTGKDHGGWRECYYTDTSGSGVTNSITCGCSYSESTCAFPLKHFLQNGYNGNNNNGNHFKLCKDGDDKTEDRKMGFDVKHLTQDDSKTGYNIYTYLEALLDPIPTPSTKSQSTPSSKPLSLLTQYCVAIGNMDPVSLGDHFDVFRELANGMWDKIEEKVKGEIKGITKDDESGQQASGKLQGALQAVMPNAHNGDAHDTADLRSLTGCGQRGSSQSCTPFLASLSHGLYKYFDPQPLRSPANKIDWLYMKMSALYGKLVTLKTEMESKCNCCPENNPQPSKPCPGITKCPNCLPQLYKMGLVFGDPKTIGTKKCSELHNVMDKVLVATSSKLCVVFQSIDGTRFWPYLLFSAMVVKEKNGKGQLTVTGDENYNCYTHALGSEYKDTYLTKVKDTDTKTAQTNKQARDEALKCTCNSHTYEQPQTGHGTATIVTLTLYFQGAYITQAVTITVPFHGPAYNPLVRLYPRNLKAIVDWLLRIGQTRLGQDGSVASQEEMIKTFWPRIETHLTEEDKNVFKDLVKGVTSLMGLQNQGKNEVKSEIDAQYEAVKKKITDKLSGNGGDGFDKTFSSILQFSPKDYIDKVIDDFGKRVYDVNGSSDTKRSFNCIAKSVSTCMSTALQTIKNLAQTNKSLESKYGISGIPQLNGTKIDDVTQLQNISNLQTLCNGFKTFHGVYKTVEKAFSTHLQQAQQKGEPWTKIEKCVDAFNELGGCAELIGELNSMSGAENMTTASGKLQALSTKLDTVHTKLSDESLSQFSDKVNTYIDALDGVLKEKGEKALEKALQINNGSKPFSDFLKSYVSELIDQLKKNDQNNTVCDIHLRVRNDLLQLSECLKVMCEVCSTGMKEFADTLKACVDKGKEHLDEIKEVKEKLTDLKTKVGELNKGDTDAYKEDKMKPKLNSSITTIHSLLSNHYIYQTQPIVDKLIDNNAVQKMTTYLKSLPDVIRDRYVLQKWQDDMAHFCGVQEFKDGIVKKSGITGIEEKLQNLLKDTFHTGTEFPITIHEFQVRALIYNFCHKEAMERIGSGVRLLYFVSHYVNDKNGTAEWSKITQKKAELKDVVDDICGNSYLKYFATHLRDSIGYHTLSNTLGALEQVKEELGKPNGSQPDKWTEIKDLLQKTAIEELQDRLSSLLDKLNREYIFEYPPFDWTKSCQKLMREQEEAKKAAEAARAKRATDASAPSPTPSNTCEMCTYSMSRIFIGFVPQMYRLFKMLREIAQKEKQSKSDTLLNAENVQDIVNKTLTVAGFFDSEGWRLKLGSGTSVPELGYDLNENKTGEKVCKLLEAIIGDKEPGALMAKDGASTADSLQPLDKLFKAVMQHFRKVRDEKRGEREQALEDEFNKKHKDSGLTFQAPPPVLPSTVRQVLFWLHELDTQGDFYKQLCDHIFTLCKQSSIKIYDGVITHLLKLSITQCLEVLATIEDPGRQNADYYYELYTEEHYYAYPVTNIPLFFYTFVEKLMGAFLELNFVCVQCEFRATEGGWSECHIGKGTMELPKIIAEHECLCKKTTVQGSTDSRLPLNSFSYSSATAAICPRPLYSFLFGENTLKAPAEKKAYMSKGTMPCGFKLKNKAITDAATPSPAPTTPLSTSMTGSLLVEPLKKLVGGHVTGRLNDTKQSSLNTLSTVIYLRDLLRYTLCLAVRPPWSMSENMAFFYRVTESWKQKGVGGVALRNDNLLGAIHAEIALFPGSFDGKKLTTAVERFAGIEDTEHQKSKTSASASPSGSHQYDLRTLMGCKDNSATSSGITAQCSPFMFPLALDVYTHYDERNSRAYLSWILNFGFGIYGQLKAMEEMIEQQQCITKGNSSCPSLPMCPGILTALYQSGSSFMDQKVLADVNKTKTVSVTTTKKTCAQFHTVLSGLFNCDSTHCTPLHNLIVQCEAFLWSIRLPFSVVQLSLWSVAILFISYVFVVPLDHFKIKSHLFNRLKYTMHPGLLIADQQRRVSEVAYFSL